MVLQYRRGGNRPITCRLLICRAQTAAVLPPMRNPQVYTASIYASNSRSRIRSPLDSRWDIRSAMAFFIPSRALIRLASRSSSPSSSSCPDTHYLLAAWTKHFLIGFRRRVMPVRLFWKQPASTFSIIYWNSFFRTKRIVYWIRLSCAFFKLLLLLMFISSR